MKKTTRLAGLIVTLTASLTFAGGDGWMTDFEAAKKKATAESKDLFVDFTGSDWCGWCIKLNDEVFKHDAFKNGVTDKFVLVELDYPQDKSKLSEATQKQNEALKDVYGIQGFPTILLMDGKGRPFAQTGYQAGGPEKYVTHLDELQAKRITRDEALTAASKLDGIDKANALVETLKLLPESYLGHYSELIDEITKLDPEDKSGFVKMQKMKEAKAQLDKDLMTAMRNGEGDTAPAMIDQFIADHNLDDQEKQTLLSTKLQIMGATAIRAGEFDKAISMVDAFIKEYEPREESIQQTLSIKVGAYLQSQKFDEADHVLDAIIAIDPESPTAAQAQAFKPRIQEMKAEAAKESKADPAGTQPDNLPEKVK